MSVAVGSRDVPVLFQLSPSPQSCNRNREDDSFNIENLPTFLKMFRKDRRRLSVYCPDSRSHRCSVFLMTVEKVPTNAWKSDLSMQPFFMREFRHLPAIKLPKVVVIDKHKLRKNQVKVVHSD